jgi:hypothetical protein
MKTPFHNLNRMLVCLYGALKIWSLCHPSRTLKNCSFQPYKSCVLGSQTKLCTRLADCADAASPHRHAYVGRRWRQSRILQFAKPRNAFTCYGRSFKFSFAWRTSIIEGCYVRCFWTFCVLDISLYRDPLQASHEMYDARMSETC